MEELGTCLSKRVRANAVQRTELKLGSKCQDVKGLKFMFNLVRPTSSLSLTLISSHDTLNLLPTSSNPPMNTKTRTIHNNIMANYRKCKDNMLLLQNLLSVKIYLGPHQLVLSPTFCHIISVYDLYLAEAANGKRKKI